MNRNSNIKIEILPKSAKTLNKSGSLARTQLKLVDFQQEPNSRLLVVVNYASEFVTRLEVPKLIRSMSSNWLALNRTN